MKRVTLVGLAGTWLALNVCCLAPVRAAETSPTASPAATAPAQAAQPAPTKSPSKGKAKAKGAAPAPAAAAPVVVTPGDEALRRYWAAETARLESACLAALGDKAAWPRQREVWRRQLREMLGLDPWPERTPLQATVTGRLEHAEFTVEKLHYQSSPHLYVTANLYLPKHRTKPAPAILYVCGHGQVKVDGVSMGNKTSYQHHGAWFARHGYVCLTIDTIQLGEIEGLHHGTNRLNQWWWNARGYTPAGVEAWNGIRGLDYLQSRPEVDPERIGVTGRSGGGAYSWWVAALDERVKVAVPVAGITDLRNHVVDGAIQGHCDCMFMVNTYRWDYPQVAALLAPRPLLLGNSDKDTIFPLDGVLRVHDQVRRVYRLLGAEANLGLLITEGPHQDTQDLQVPALRWFDRFLKQETTVIADAATKFFPPAELKVFARLPADEGVTKVQETFGPTAAVPTPPREAADWARQRDGWLQALREKCFRGWPDFGAGATPELDPQVVGRATAQGTDLYVAEFTSQEQVRLRVYGVGPRGAQFQKVCLRLLDAESYPVWVAAAAEVWGDALAPEVALQAKLGRAVDPAAVQRLREELTVQLASQDTAICLFAPRGIGYDQWTLPAKTGQHVLRRFNLLGQTADGMRVWDIQRAIAAIRQFDLVRSLPLEIEARGAMGVNALYAALFLDHVDELRLTGLPASHRTGPDYLNVLRYLDVPQAVALAAERARVRLAGGDPAAWRYPLDVAKNLRWAEDRLLCE